MRSVEIRDIRYQENAKHIVVKCEWTRDLNGARTWENIKKIQNE